MFHQKYLAPGNTEGSTFDDPASDYDAWYEEQKRLGLEKDEITNT